MGAEPTVSQALELLAGALARQEKTDPDASDRLVITTALPVLRKAMVAFPSAPDRRQARSAYRMACAALGIDHE